jgi:O-antigen/teichoic acid export membrane protein
MTLMKRSLSGVAWSVAGGYGAQFLMLAMFIFISRLVGPEAFGVVAVAIGVVELCRAFTTEGAAAMLTAQATFDEESYNAGFAWALGSTIVTCITLILCTPWLADVFGMPGLGGVMPQIALLLVFYGLSRLQEARLTQEMRFRALAGRTVLAALIGGGVGIVAAIAGLGVQALIYQQLVAASISAALLWRACHWRPRFTFSSERFYAVVRGSFTLAPAGLVTSLCALGDGLAVGIFSGPLAAGIYNLGKRVRTAMVLGLSSALDRVSLPAFAQLRGAPAHLTAAVEQAVSISALTVFPIFFGLAGISPEMVAIALGPEWAGASVPIAILLIAGAIAIATSYCENVLLVFERRRSIVALRLYFLGALLVGIALFGRQGPTAIAAVTLVATIVQNLAAVAAVRRSGDILFPRYLSSILLPLALNATMIGALWLLRQFTSIADLDAPARIIVLILTGLTFYASATWLFARTEIRSAYLAARAQL